MIKALYLLLFLFFWVSCGLRESTEEYDNPLEGTWVLTEYNCAETFTETVGKEIYDFEDSSIDITVKFDASKITYNSVGTCTTSSYGAYSLVYDESESGQIDISNVVSGGTTCTEDVTDSGDDLVGTVSVNTTMDGTDTQDLEWFIESNVLYIQNFTNFYGSSDIFVCNGECICRGTFTKQ